LPIPSKGFWLFRNQPLQSLKQFPVCFAHSYIAQRQFGERQRFSLKLLLIRHDYIAISSMSLAAFKRDSRLAGERRR
jgi:hypothetical protein